MVRTLGWVLLLGMAGTAVSAADADRGWQELAGYLFRDAGNEFARPSAGTPADRALGAAASLLNTPPITPGKIADAEAQLRAVADDKSAGEAALYARYLIARIAHLHRPAEAAEIETAYRAVLASAPAGHPLAQLSAGKLALVLLYQRPDLTVAQRLVAAAELAPVAGAAGLPETGSAYYRAMAGAALYYDVLDERVLDWLRQADRLVPGEATTASTLKIQMAEVARALGHRDAALGYYRAYFAAAVPTDSRYRTAQDRYAQLVKEAR